jgi:hypothetical protein
MYHTGEKLWIFARQDPSRLCESPLTLRSDVLFKCVDGRVLQCKLRFVESEGNGTCVDDQQQRYEVASWSPI